MSNELLSAFEEHRGLLFSIAYRMLGSVVDAEDMLQDAFIRWQRASEVDIRSPKAFLVTIVSRLCINHLQSARVQREAYVGERSEEHTSELQSHSDLVCRLLLE